MTAILLAVILVLGYHYESKHPIRRLTLIRESGYNLYFKIGYTGFGIVLYALIPACLVVFIMAVINGVASPSVLYTDKNLTEFFSTTLCISLMLFAVLFAKSRLWAAQKRFKGVTTADYSDDSKTIHSDDTKREMYNAVMRAANDMEREIILAARDLIPVRIILPNGKVYIGWPQQPDLQDGEIRHLRILPILSGFLNEKQTMVITRNYYRHYKQCYDEDGSLNDDNDSGHDHITRFTVILPIEEIKVFSLFSKAAFDAIEADPA